MEKHPEFTEEQIAYLEDKIINPMACIWVAGIKVKRRKLLPDCKECVHKTMEIADFLRGLRSAEK